MTTNLIDVNVLFDQTLELRHITGALYALASAFPCRCEDGLPVCGDPECEDCFDREPCPRCAPMIQYERWVGYENLPFLHPNTTYTGYRPQCDGRHNESTTGEDNE